MLTARKSQTYRTSADEENRDPACYCHCRPGGSRPRGRGYEDRTDPLRFYSVRPSSDDVR